MSQSTLRLADDAASRPMPRKLRFTVASLNAVKIPDGKDRAWVYDDKAPGLAFMVTGKGAAAFYLCRRIGGQAKRLRLGGFPDISIEQARTLSAKMLGQIADGKDPAAERKAIRKSITLQELWDRFDAEYCKARYRDRTKAVIKSLFDTCFEDWKSRPLASIRPADVVTKHTRIGKGRGHTTANHAVRLLRRMCNWAKIEPNPAKGGTVEYFHEATRERFVQPDELPKIFAALDASVNETIRDFIYMALWSGARRSNVQAMRWADVNLASATWTIPAGQSKSREAMMIHLPTPAVEILKRRSGNGSEFVFPGRGKSGHLVEPKTAWAKILKAAGVADLHVHDLRRTMGSWMAAGGASLPMIGKQLGHHDAKATAIYARLNVEPVRQFVDAAASAMVKASKPEEVVN